MPLLRRLPLAVTALATTLAVLAGCATKPPPEPPEPVAGGACDASKAQFAVGQQPGLAVQDQARERAEENAREQADLDSIGLMRARIGAVA